MMRNWTPAVLILALLLIACGNKNNFQSVDEPELQIDGSGTILIQMPPDDSRTAAQEALIIRNQGDAPLTITKLQFIDRPDRLVALGARGGSCSTDADCEGATDEDGNALNSPICITAGQTCTATGLPATPFEIGPQLRKDVDFAITIGGTEMNCPEAPADVPIEVGDRYCGSILIETNAVNSSAIVNEGKAKIYFIDPGTSGQIKVVPDFLEFTNVQPGTSHMKSFSVQNEGSTDLEVYGMIVQDASQFFSIESTTGGGLSATIPSGGSTEWNLKLDIPEGTEPAAYEVFTILEIDSSAGNANDGQLSVQVSADAGSAPVIDVSPDTLRFDAAQRQTITVSNNGQATLQLNGVRVEPGSAAAFYRIEHEGNDVTNNFQNINVAKDASTTLDVVFERPAGNMDAAVGQLVVSHNDRNAGFQSTVTLLGDAGDVPIGQVSPSSFTFLAADGNSDAREFSVRNVGTASLSITGLSFNFSTGSLEEFQITPQTATIPAGGLQSFTVQFSGANATPDVGIVTLDSDNPTPLEVALFATDSAQAQPVGAIEVVTAGALRAGSPVELSAAATTPPEAINNVIWTILSRPAGSSSWTDAVGQSMTFTPDVAGTYRVGLLVHHNGREGQVARDLTVE